MSLQAFLSPEMVAIVVAGIVAASIGVAVDWWLERRAEKRSRQWRR